MATTYRAGRRPRIRVFNANGEQNPLPNLVLTKINSKSAYFRSSHVVGEMGISISGDHRGRVEIIRHPDGTPVLETEQWPPLTPYDRGERAQPRIWVTPDRRRPEEHDPDRYGKVDFDDDTDTTIAVVWLERGPEGGYTLHAYSMDDEDIPVVMNGERLPRPGAKPVVLMRNGETFEGDDVDVIDITTLLSVEPARSEWTKEEALGTAETLRKAGYESAADEIEEWWR